MKRRALLALGCALTPMAAALLAACGEESGTWAEGMLPIKWDRDTCVRCSMVISDRRFAAQVRGGPKNTAFKFDDIGCAATWCAEKTGQHPWLGEPATRYWVAAFDGKGEKWLDARRAHYVTGARSPMGYDFGAYAEPRPGSIGFDAMAGKVTEAWPANCTARDAAPAAGTPARGGAPR